MGRRRRGLVAKESTETAVDCGDVLSLLNDQKGSSMSESLSGSAQRLLLGSPSDSGGRGTRRKAINSTAALVSSQTASSSLSRAAYGPFYILEGAAQDIIGCYGIRNIFGAGLTAYIQ